MLQWLGFADTLKRGTLYLFDKGIDASQDVSVSALPIERIFPRMLRKNEIHSSRLIKSIGRGTVIPNGCDGSELVRVFGNPPLGC
jgi:hypothetical protein